MISRFFKAIWRLLSGVSKVISVLIPLVLLGTFLVAIGITLSDSTPEPLPEKAALWIAPSGALLEDRPATDPVAAFLSQEFDSPSLLDDVVQSLRFAAADDRITSVVFNLENVVGPTTSQTLEINAALREVQASGKPVIALGDFFTQGQYLLAAQADHVLLHPEGGMLLEGFSVYRAYLKRFLDKIRVTMNVFRAGQNKSAVEPYIRDSMSDSEREVVSRWLNSLWSAYAVLAEQGRDKPAGSLNAYIETFPEQLEASGGDLSGVAVSAGWVDELTDHAEMEERLREWVGATNEDGDAEMIPFERYLEDMKMQHYPEEEALPLIAIVPVEGTLMPGESEEGLAGSDTIEAYIDRAVETEDLAAVVLRINSPGGSVFASDLIRRKLNELKTLEVPLVVSMGTVAASGGYWIAAEADEIWALPTTLTGSIGAFSAFPTFEGLVDYANITVDGVGTTSLAGQASLERGVSPEMQRVLQAMADHTYDDFVELVARGRQLDRSDVDQIAEGLVWTGQEALEIGLVDQLGGLDEAVAAAAALAEVDAWRVRRIGEPPSFEGLLLAELSRSFNLKSLSPSGWVQTLMQTFRPALQGLDQFRDPMNVYVQCLLCGPTP